MEYRGKIRDKKGRGGKGGEGTGEGGNRERK